MPISDPTHFGNEKKGNLYYFGQLQGTKLCPVCWQHPHQERQQGLPQIAVFHQLLPDARYDPRSCIVRKAIAQGRCMFIPHAGRWSQQCAG